MPVKQFAYAESSETSENSEKKNSQFVYSLILIFLIPILIILNTFWGMQNFRKNIESELQSKADLAEAVFASSAADSLDQTTVLQAKIEEVVQSSTEIEAITIYKSINDGFQVVASSNSEDIGLAYKSLQYTSAWVENKKITLLTPPQKNSPGGCVVIAPLKDKNQQKVALLNLQMSTADADALAQKTLTNSLIALGILIFFVLLLLFNYFHFFEYAILFKRLKEVDAMKDNFISMASHELKTPMAAIKGYISMIFEGVAGQIDKKAKIHLEKVLANVQRLDALVNALLDVSRLQQGRMLFEMQAVDLTPVLQGVISAIKVEADKKGLKITYEPLAEPHPFIFADPARLDQIFENVIGNAIKYTFKGGVSIYHRIEEDQLKTIIQDTGIGMSKPDMEDLFTRFYRIRNEKTADIPGTGLGLWITKEITLKMNGRIYAESRAGVGSTFTIIFPIIKEKK